MRKLFGKVRFLELDGLGRAAKGFDNPPDEFERLVRETPALDAARRAEQRDIQPLAFGGACNDAVTFSARCRHLHLEPNNRVNDLRDELAEQVVLVHGTPAAFAAKSDSLSFLKIAVTAARSQAILHCWPFCLMSTSLLHLPRPKPSRKSGGATASRTRCGSL